MTSMIVDPVYASTGISEMTSTEYADITAAVAALSAKTDVMAMVNSIFGNVIFTTFSDGLTSPGTGMYGPYMGADPTFATWRSNLITHLASQGVSYDPDNDSVVLILPGTFTSLNTPNGYLLATPSGGSFQYTLERLMFHEMAHAASLPTATIADAYLRGNYSLTDPWEADTIAIAAENIIYRQAFSLTGDINGGHDGVSNTPNFSGVGAFDEINGSPTMVSDIVDAAQSTIFSETEGTVTVKKYVFERGYDPAGFDSTKLNHYIVNEIIDTDGIITEEGEASDILSVSLSSDSASSNFDIKVSLLSTDLDELYDFTDVVDNLNYIPFEISSLFEALPSLNQEVSRLISIETSSIAAAGGPPPPPPHFAVGPQAADPSGANNGTPEYIALQASDDISTVLVGASGFNDRNVDFTASLDDLKGSTGDDLLVGGDGSGPNGTDRSVLDGDGGDDIIVSGSGRSKIVGGAGDDLLFAGSGNTEVDGGSGTDVFSFLDKATAFSVDLSNVDGNGAGLATQGSASARIKGVEVFYGGDALTTFKGRAGGGGATFIAGAGGGDFTLTAGDRAFGRTGVEDVYRVTTTVPSNFSALSEQEKIEYLAHNRVYIGNFGTEDEIYVNGTLFTGNSVAASIGTPVASDYNRDVPISAVALIGNSSYATSYATPTFVEDGLSWGGAPYGRLAYANDRIQDVSYSVADETGIGLINFMSRGITGAQDGSLSGYTLDALTSSDEMLTIVIDGFSNGDGGINFENEGLANLDRPSAFDEEGTFYSFNHDVGWADYARVSVGVDEDVDGTLDGYMSGGDTPIPADDPRFNLGLMPFAGEDMDWEWYVRPPQNLEGTNGDDELEGSTANDTLNGNDGDDLLFGGPGDDVLSGGNGYDELYGDEGNDTLLGGADDDWLEGGDGNDVIDGGDGNDTASYWGWSTDFRIYRDLDGSIAVENTQSDNDVDHLTNVEELYFDDTVIEASAIPVGTTGNDIFVGTGIEDVFFGLDGDDDLDGDDGNDRLYGNDGADTLTGGAGDDRLDGGAGDDLMAGGEGDDTYVVDSSSDIVSENTDEGVDTIVTTLAAFTLGSDVENLTYVGTGNFVGEGNELNNVLTGGIGNDTLSGDDGDDYFHASAGADIIDGGDGWDTVALSGRADSYYYSDDGNGVFTITDGTNSLQLTAIESVYFEGEDQEYDPSDLISIAIGGTSGDDAMLTGDWNDNRISGFAGNDTLWGQDGNDRLDGGDGTDTAYYSGSSTDYAIYRDTAGGIVVEDLFGNDGWDRILNIESIYFDGDSVTVDPEELPALGTSGNDNLSGSERPDKLYGLAGNDTLDAGEGDDQLEGGTGDDTFIMGAGNDSAHDESGDDTYVFGADSSNTSDDGGDDTYQFHAGDGNAHIQDFQGSDTLTFGAGILPEDIWFTVDSSNNITVNITGQTGKVTIGSGMLEDSAIEQIVFSDSTTWDLAEQLRTPTSGDDHLYGGAGDDTIDGEAGNDQIYGRQGNDILNGGLGNDILLGASGNDTYQFELGGGQDIVRDQASDSAGSGGTDIVEFGAGILPGDIVVSQADSGRDLVLSISGTSDKITLDNTSSESGYHIEEIHFADSTVWTDDDLMAMVLVPTSGNDTLYGSFKAETISAGAGNDTITSFGGDDDLTGGTGNDIFFDNGGNDTYHFALGDGQDTIHDSSGSQDVIEFAAGIDPDDVEVSKTPNGSGMILSITGTSDQITISDAVTDNSSHVEQVYFDDSTVWDYSDLLSMANGGAHPMGLRMGGASLQVGLPANETRQPVLDEAFLPEDSWGGSFGDLLREQLRQPGGLSPFQLRREIGVKDDRFSADWRIMPFSQVRNDLGGLAGQLVEASAAFGVQSAPMIDWRSPGHVDQLLPLGFEGRRAALM